MTDLTKLAELRRAATPGPWRAVCGDAMNPDNDPAKGDSVTAFLGWEVEPVPQSERRAFESGWDAAFIAAAGSVPPETWEALARVVAAAKAMVEPFDIDALDADDDPWAERERDRRATALRDALRALEDR